MRCAGPKQALARFHLALEALQNARERGRGGHIYGKRTALVQTLENEARKRVRGRRQGGPGDDAETSGADGGGGSSGSADSVGRRQEALVRLNLSGALQLIGGREARAALTQAQTALTLLLHDAPNDQLSGSLLALAHCYVGLARKEVAQGAY